MGLGNGGFGRGWKASRGDKTIRHGKPQQQVIKRSQQSKQPNVPAPVIHHTSSGPIIPPDQLKPIFIPSEYYIRAGTTMFNVVILSADPSNLKACLKGLFLNEPDMVGHVIVVDDGARKGDVAEVPGIVWVPGKKPFVFARNSNLGIRQAAPNDVILLNDDAILKTRHGFTLLAQAARQRPNMGLCSAGIAGHVGNPHQKVQGAKGVRQEKRKLAFVCIYIPRAVISELGELDERFVGYGYDDDDYCTRATRTGLSLGIFDECVVEHGSIPSTFRAKKNYPKLMNNNRRLYQEKWHDTPPMA